MTLLFSSLLLASYCAHSSWSMSLMDQTPDFSVVEGETVNITCCWTNEYTRGRVNWLKNNNSIEMKNVETYRITQYQQQNCSYLTIMNIITEDSGRYACNLKVEIPSLKVLEGNGTTVTVTAMKGNTTGDIGYGPTLPVIICLATGVPLLLIALAWFCVLRRRRALAASFIYEVPLIDTDIDMDKHSRFHSGVRYQCMNHVTTLNKCKTKEVADYLLTGISSSSNIKFDM